VYGRGRERLLALVSLIALPLGVSCLFPSFEELGSGAGAAGTGGATGSGAGSTSCGGGSSGEGGTASGGGGASSSSGTGGSGPPCSGKGGSPGVYVDPPGALVPYCIDATEVSAGHYRDFYDFGAFPLTVTFPAQCAWKSNVKASFRPKDYIWMHFQNTGNWERPISGVDWCDAAIYCLAQGKRLCGSETDQGRIDPDGDPNWRQSGEWYRACGGPNGTAYAYGMTYQGGVCTDNGGPMPPENDPFNTTNVDEPATCVASWPDGDIYNMNANLTEWENNCEDGAAPTLQEDPCWPRGGSYNLNDGNEIYTRCDSVVTAPGYERSAKGDYAAIRCCWTP
jgi:formylglycine-generating enzyme